MNERSGPAGGDIAAPAAFGSQRGRVAFALLLAALLAVPVSVAALGLRGTAEPWLLGAGAVLSLLGLFLIFGMLAGFVQFGRGLRHREFFDGMVDALGDAIVVTDSRGRAVFANAAYRQAGRVGRHRQARGHGCAVCGLSRSSPPRSISWPRR